MKRIIKAAQFTIQLDNVHIPAQWGAPAVLVTTVEVLPEGDSKDAKALYSPTQRMEPVVKEDMTDELLAELNAKLDMLGLELIRKA